jgi:arsenate reductase
MTPPVRHDYFSVHPEVVTAMREVGTGLATVRPQKLTDELAATASLLVTMGCGEACPWSRA